MGMEREGDFARAAECYEKAWHLEFESSASIGYKLAFSYLQQARHVEAIDICEVRYTSLYRLYRLYIGVCSLTGRHYRPLLQVNIPYQPQF